MKNVLKTLQAEKAAIEKDFGELDKQRQAAIAEVNKLNTGISQIVAGLTQLQGKWAAVDKMEAEFKDEPKPKKD